MQFHMVWYPLGGQGDTCELVWSPQTGRLAFQGSKDRILKNQALFMVRVQGRDPLSADAEESSPDSDDSASVRYSLRPD